MDPEVCLAHNFRTSVLRFGVNTYGLSPKCAVKMAGYWPNVFFACLWTEMEWRSINSQEKNKASIQPSGLTSLVNKGFIIIQLSGRFFLQDRAGSPDWAR